MQTKPLRSFGMDITEKSLQPVLDEIGLKNSDGTARTVRDLSQAEKQIVRYLSVLKQSAEAHGDWANTIKKIVAHIRNYMMKKLVNLYKKGVRMINEFNSTQEMVCEHSC